MGQRHQHVPGHLQGPDVLDRRHRRGGVPVESAGRRRSPGHAHRPGAPEQGPVMAAVASHEDPFVSSRQRQGAQVPGHVARCGEEEEAAVAEEVVDAVEGGEERVRAGAVAEFAVPRMVEGCAGERRRGHGGPARCAGRPAAGAGKDGRVREARAVPDVVEVEVAEDDGGDGRRVHGTLAKEVAGVLRDAGLDDVE